MKVSFISCVTRKLVSVLFCLVLAAQQVVPLQAGPLPSVELPRMSKVTIAETTAKLQTDMSRIKWRFGGIVSVFAGATVTALWQYRDPLKQWWFSKKSPDPITSATMDDIKKLASHNASLLAWERSWTFAFVKAFAFALAASSAGIIWASWQDAAENASSSLKRWMVGLTKGYKGWLLHEAAVLEKNARVLYHSLTYASNSNVPAAQLVNYQPIMKDDDELAHLGYRGDSARRFEYMYHHLARILSLLFLTTPQAEHPRVHIDVTVVMQHLNGLATLVERDINNATSRFIVEYEKETQRAFVDLFEELHARLARYDIAARS